MTCDQTIKTYNLTNSKKRLFILLVLLALVICSFWSLLTGPSQIGFKELASFLTGEADVFTKQVLIHLRIPRILGAIIAGMALSISGVVMQSLLRNPLASPFTLGISSASAFGAAFAIIFLGAGVSYQSSNDLSTISNPYILTFSAFAWSVLSVLLILSLARLKGAGPEIIILAGIIISSLFGSGIAAMQYFADSVQLASIVFWTFGDLGRATWHNVVWLLIIQTPVLVFFMFNTWNYKALHAGDEYAHSTGVNVSRVRLMGMVVASLATAAVVAFFGVIAFIGLVVPHIVRRIIGGDENFLIPASALFGGLFLLASDTLARSIISPVVLPVGILTSFLGAPLFLFLLIKGVNKSYWS